jgi:tetratricopeptide (TPR) repeat protein
VGLPSIYVSQLRNRYYRYYVSFKSESPEVRTIVAHLGSYYYGQHKWDNYLLDIQRSIEAGSAAQLQGHQLNELRQQTEQIRRIEDAVLGGFEELRAEFQWGFTLMVDRMEKQIDRLSQIAASLDAIHKTLQSPLLTQARELFLLGQEHFRKGLLDKALEAYLRAEQKNEVDFPLQLQIGKLFLYGRDEDDDVIDLRQAEKHLLLGARYSDAEKGTFSEWKEYCGQAYFHAAVAAYLIGEQEQGAQRLDSTRSCLERALGHLAEAENLWPQFTEIAYTQAKCHALLGNKQEALKRFWALSDRDRRYCTKASQDADFAAFHSEIVELFGRACTSPGSLALAVASSLEEAKETFPWVKLGNAENSRSDAIQRELRIAERTLPTLDADLEALNRRVPELRKALEDLVEDGLVAQVSGHTAELESLDSRLVHARKTVEQLRERLKATKGGYTGCFFMVLTCVFAAYLGSQLGGPRLMPPSFIAGIIISFPVYFLVNRFAPSRAERDIQKQITQNLQVIELSEQQSRTSKNGMAEAQQQLARFRSWRDKRPHLSPPPMPPSGRGDA